MDGYSIQALALLDEGRYAELISLLRDAIAANKTKYGTFITDEFKALCRSRGIYIYVLLEWDGNPKGSMVTTNGVTRWVDSPVRLAA
jgi:hypothetical protein